MEDYPPQNNMNNEFDIAIIGMSCRFPGAQNVDEFWHNLANGVESITKHTDEEILQSGVPASYLNNPNYVKASPILDKPELFDAGFFGFAPMEAKTMDPQHRILLELAYEALENAGYDADRFEGRIGVYTGSAMNTYFMNSFLHTRFVEEYIPTLIVNDKDFLSTKLSYKLNLKGPSITVQTACSTSLVAVHLAYQSLLSEESDMALAGAISVRVPHKAGYICDGGGIVSPDGHVRAFDASANGTVFGSGGGIIVLKRLSEAIAAGDTIHAVIKGSAVNNDGSEKAGYTAPSVNRQAEAVIEALANADVTADSISYIEAHGSGTPLGDPIEMAALTKAFRTFTERSGYCAIGSVKTNVGHLDVAAGIAGIIKTVLALKNKRIPPSLHYSQPNPEIDFARTPFFVNTQLSEWESKGPRRAGVMSTGMGGTNAYLVLEETPKIEKTVNSHLPNLLVMSAKTETALDSATKRLSEFLKSDASINIDDVAYTLQVGRKSFNSRKFLVCEHRDEAINILEEEGSKRIASAALDGSVRRPLIFLFPGIGDHYVGMAYDLYQNYAIFKGEVDRCAQILESHLDIDIREIIYPKDSKWKDKGKDQGIDLKKMLGRKPDGAVDASTAKLNQTIYAQPAQFTIEYALARFWNHLGITPDAIVGHSMGEYVAACLAGVFSLEDALRLIATRAKMVNELPMGAMLAVTLPESELLPILNEDLSVSLVNGPELCVVAGPASKVVEFENLLEEKGIICRHIQNAHAFHSAMLDPIVSAFEDEVKQVRLKEPTMPYISNVTGNWISNNEATDPGYWAKHANHTARFSDALQTMWNYKNPILLEVGPGRTLGVLAMQHPKRQEAGNPVSVSSLRHDYENYSDIEFMLQSIGKLWLSGVDINWEQLQAGGIKRRIPMPTYPFERESYWLEANSLPLATPQSQVSIQKVPNIAEWFYIPSWKRMLPKSVKTGEMSKITERKQVWLVFTDDCGVASGLIKKLETAGQEVVTVIRDEKYKIVDSNTFTVNASEPENYALLIKALQANNKVPDNIVHAWSISINNSEQSKSDVFKVAQELGFYSVLFLIKALAKKNISDDINLFILSNNIQDVYGLETLNPDKSTILGPCMVIPQEYPNIRSRSIDIELEEKLGADEANVDLLFGEFFNLDSDMFIAHRANQRWVQTFERVFLDESHQDIPIFRKGGVYLITGGLGNIGYEISKYLASTYNAKLVLVGRSHLPLREDWKSSINFKKEDDAIWEKINKIRKLEALGAEVLYIRSNVADFDGMQEVIKKTRETFGRLHGIIHGAGIVGERGFKEIADINTEICDLHFKAKAHGLHVMEKILNSQSLDFCMLLSSLTPILGGIGEVAYSSSNIYMDAFVRKHNQSNDIPWLSINWDLWRLDKDKGNKSGIGKTLEELGITAEEGMKAMEIVLPTRGVSQIVVSTGDLNARINQWIKLDYLRGKNHEKHPNKITLTVSERPKIQAEFKNPRDETEQVIAQIWQDVLGIDQVGIDDNFSELGGHSLLAIKIISELRKAFLVDLPVRALFDTPTINDLAENIKNRIVAEIEELSDEEARQLISDN